jgi:hypothetical protein
MPWVGFKPTIPTFERAKTFRALDSAAIVISVWGSERLKFNAMLRTVHNSTSCISKPVILHTLTPTMIMYILIAKVFRVRELQSAHSRHYRHLLTRGCSSLRQIVGGGRMVVVCARSRTWRRHGQVRWVQCSIAWDTFTHWDILFPNLFAICTSKISKCIDTHYTYSGTQRTAQ